MKYAEFLRRWDTNKIASKCGGCLVGLRCLYWFLIGKEAWLVLGPSVELKAVLWTCYWIYVQEVLSSWFGTLGRVWVKTLERSQKRSRRKLVTRKLR